MLFSKQDVITSKYSWVLNPSIIKRRGFPAARSLVARSNTFFTQCKFYFRVHVALITACIVLIWGVVRDPRVLYCLTRPDDQQRQASTIYRDALHYSDHSATQLIDIVIIVELL